MKKVLLILALAMFSFANAQKGTILVSGNVGFSSEKMNSSGNESTQSSFGIFPKVGYQFADSWTVGVQSSLSFVNNVTDSTNGHSNNYGIGAFVRYSKPVSELFTVYADLGTGFSFGNGSYSNSGTAYVTSKSNGFGINISPALLINIKKGYGLNFGFGGLGYSSSKVENQTIPNSFQNSKIFDFSFGQAFTVGISKNF
ncbi:outer membrane beta-barrel protein [Flavobacterium sp.]|uniref:outer membrane beta-barrel protein n=1 Tax=Flavobacterium sp. TaxID=239 RepID=UPI0037514D49